MGASAGDAGARRRSLPEPVWPLAALAVAAPPVAVRTSAHATQLLQLVQGPFGAPVERRRRRHLSCNRGRVPPAAGRRRPAERVAATRGTWRAWRTGSRQLPTGHGTGRGYDLARRRGANAANVEKRNKRGQRGGRGGRRGSATRARSDGTGDPTRRAPESEILRAQRSPARNRRRGMNGEAATEAPGSAVGTAQVEGMRRAHGHGAERRAVRRPKAEAVAGAAAVAAAIATRRAGTAGRGRSRRGRHGARRRVGRRSRRTCRPPRRPASRRPPRAKPREGRRRGSRAEAAIVAKRPRAAKASLLSRRTAAGRGR